MVAVRKDWWPQDAVTVKDQPAVYQTFKNSLVRHYLQISMGFVR